MMDMLENVSGSIYFKRDYDQVKEEITHLQQLIGENQERHTYLSKERKKIKEAEKTILKHEHW